MGIAEGKLESVPPDLQSSILVIGPFSRMFNAQFISHCSYRLSMNIGRFPWSALALEHNHGESPGLMLTLNLEIIE